MINFSQAIRLVGILLIISLAFSTKHFYSKVSTLGKEVATLQTEVSVSKLKLQVMTEEYNNLQNLYDKGDRGKQVSQEKTDAAKTEHRNNGSVTRASPSDARLLEQRSREVRGDTLTVTSQAD